MSNITLKKLNNKKICILGYGIENQALVKYLIAKKIKADITICDSSKGVRHPFECRTPLVSWQLGKTYDKHLDQYDIIFRIAGYPLFTPEIIKARQAGVEISSPTKLFFELCPTKNIIGVTGTKGKGTTASLIYSILKKAGQQAYIGGNIGIPMFSFLNKIKPRDWVILELSSFQLENLETSPRIAVITNFYREHLAPADPNNPNYHKSLSSYWQAKSNIFKWQKKNNAAIINKNLKNKTAEIGLGKKIYFNKSNMQTKLIGEYNKENIAATIETARLAGVKMKVIKKVIKNFKNLKHRLEFVCQAGQVKYYNNSFATTPEATIADLNSFKEPIILLAGGADKGSSFRELAKAIKKKVKFAVLLKGQATPRIKKELLKIKYPKNKMKLIDSMREAVKTAKQNSVAGDIVLLSTGCASFGMFKNYKERGNLFKKEVIKK